MSTPKRITQDETKSDAETALSILRGLLRWVSRPVATPGRVKAPAGSVDALIAQDSKEAAAFWRDYTTKERDWLLCALNQIISRGPLLHEYQEEVEAYVATYIEFRPRPFMTPIPVLKTLMDEAKYALAWLTTPAGLNCRVVACKKCGVLVLVTHKGGGRGRPRSAFCSEEHAKTYHQQKYMARKKAAAKHK